VTSRDLLRADWLAGWLADINRVTTWRRILNMFGTDHK